VLVKGGHAVVGTSDEAVDVLWDGQRLLELRSPRIAGSNDHGTGCSLASAIAAGLAKGDDLGTAVAAAKAYVARALAGGAGWRLGAGHGPLDHFGWSS
jgi:hydroxymethylpyrimidine kinase/phosphomethylpyrimidine kinase